jgi:hypothetical protein
MAEKDAEVCARHITIKIQVLDGGSNARTTEVV